MIHSRRICLPAAVAFALALAAPAASARDPGAGRYEMQAVEGGVVRLDTETGAMTLCRKRDDRLDCGPARAETQALANRIAALKERVDRLEARLRKAAAEAPTGSSDRQLDEAMNTARRVMRHFFGMVEDLEKDLRKPAAPEDGAVPGGQRT